MRLLGKFGTVGGATMVSRILGFVREAMIAAALGAGPVADVFYAAFRFPNLFRRLLAEGTFNLAFIPLFARTLEEEGEITARRFAEEVLAMLLIILIALSALAEITMPLLVSTIIAPHFTEDKFTLTVELARIMFPYLFAMSLAAMLSSILNTLRRYLLAAIAPVALNITLIGVLILAHHAGAGADDIGRLLAVGVFFAGFLQLGILIVGVRRAGFPLRIKPPRLSPQVKRLLLLTVPVVITGGITQFNLFVGQIIASAREGAIAVLSYADRIYQLPLGVIGIAIGVVLMPELSRALKTKGTSPENVNLLQNRSLEFALCFTLPAAVGLAVLAQPIVNVLFERGAFTAHTTAITGETLLAFALGLPAFVLIKVFTPGFFAREDSRTPMRFAAIGVAINIVGSLILFPSLGPMGIAFATTVASWVNTGLLVRGLRKRGHFALRHGSGRRLSAMLTASLVMGTGLYIIAQRSALWFEGVTLGWRALGLMGLIGLGMMVYFALVLISGAIDRNELRIALTRRK